MNEAVGSLDLIAAKESGVPKSCCLFWFFCCCCGLVFFLKLIVSYEVLRDQGAFVWLSLSTVKKKWGSVVQERILMINTIYVYASYIFILI